MIVNFLWPENKNKNTVFSPNIDLRNAWNTFLKTLKNCLSNYAKIIFLAIIFLKLWAIKISVSFFVRHSVVQVSHIWSFFSKKHWLVALNKCSSLEETCFNFLFPLDSRKFMIAKNIFLPNSRKFMSKISRFFNHAKLSARETFYT